MKSEKRIKKIESVVRARQHSLRVVIENIHDPHNVSAIFRTCDAVGIPKISLIYTFEKFPKIGKKTSASAFKWIEKDKYDSAEKCFAQLKQEGFEILASSIDDEAVELYDLDLTKKVAFVLGNEHRGVSDSVANLADKKFKIPMYGMVQSLNVSVANAVIIYEALRQRLRKGQYDKSSLSETEIQQIIDDWCRK